MKAIILTLMVSILSACASSKTTPVVITVEKTVLVVVTATNPPATAVPTLPPATATSTTTTAPTKTPVPTVVLPSATPAPTLTTTITQTPTKKPLPTLVPLAGISISGGFPGKIFYLPVASTQLEGQYKPDNGSTGLTVSSVTFKILFGNQLVYSSQVTQYPYCAFGNKGSTCNPLIFDDYVYTWPGNHISIQNGSYVLHVTVLDNAATNNTWSLDVPFKIVLPQ